MKAKRRYNQFVDTMGENIIRLSIAANIASLAGLEKERAVETLCKRNG